MGGGDTIYYLQNYPLSNIYCNSFTPAKLDSHSIFVILLSKNHVDCFYLLSFMMIKLQQSLRIPKHFKICHLDIWEEVDKVCWLNLQKLTKTGEIIQDNIKVFTFMKLVKMFSDCRQNLGVCHFFGHCVC